MKKKKDRKKEAFEDDGRTIFDMSGVSRPGLFGHWDEMPGRFEEEEPSGEESGDAEAPERGPFCPDGSFQEEEGARSAEADPAPPFREEQTEEGTVIYDADEEAPQERPWETAGLTGEERRFYVLGALGATMLIVLAFLAGLGIVIALLIWLWS